jgi:hypothetical protein
MTTGFQLLWWIAGGGALLLVIAGVVLMRPSAALLKEKGVGIVPFERAGTPARSGNILRLWGADGRQAASNNLFADFPFLVGYAVLLFVLCWGPSAVLGELQWPIVTWLSRAVAVGALAAGISDAVEDLCLLKILRDYAESADPAAGPTRTAANAATIKFALIGVAIGWWLLYALPSLLAGIP